MRKITFLILLLTFFTLKSGLYEVSLQDGILRKIDTAQDRITISQDDKVTLPNELTQEILKYFIDQAFEEAVEKIKKESFLSRLNPEEKAKEIIQSARAHEELASEKLQEIKQKTKLKLQLEQQKSILQKNITTREREISKLLHSRYYNQKSNDLRKEKKSKLTREIALFKIEIIHIDHQIVTLTNEINNLSDDLEYELNEVKKATSTDIMDCFSSEEEEEEEETDYLCLKCCPILASVLKSIKPLMSVNKEVAATIFKLLSDKFKNTHSKKSIAIILSKTIGGYMLLKKILNRNKLEKHDCCSLAYASKLKRPGVIKLLLKHGTDLNETCKKDQTTPLINAIWKGDKNLVNFLLEKCVNLNDPNILRVACESDSKEALEIIGLLLSKLSNPEEYINKSNLDNCQTPIFYAIESGNYDIVNFLLNNGAKLNLYNIYGVSPLHHALKNMKLAKEDETNKENFLKIIKLLVNNNISCLNEQTNVATNDTNEDSPLILAIKVPNYELVEFFITNGAIVSYKNAWGQTAIKIALDRIKAVCKKVKRLKERTKITVNSDIKLFESEFFKKVLIAEDVSQEQAIKETNEFNQRRLLRKQYELAELLKIYALFAKLDKK